ncbi:hypothetical protein CDAR_286831 [Caerostris darwini]|uniref:Uncharacterized protein n=1 Tax=Caerostris darwini TaxID=1538125 RepID=A0AAV4RDD6_9ARAC|nr:hypothetical protein CDAR_286831 [Caerostris darwini]
MLKIQQNKHCKFEFQKEVLEIYWEIFDINDASSSRGQAVMANMDKISTKIDGDRRAMTCEIDQPLTLSVIGVLEIPGRGQAVMANMDKISTKIDGNRRAMTREIDQPLTLSVIGVLEILGRGQAVMANMDKISTKIDGNRRAMTREIDQPLTLSVIGVLEILVSVRIIKKFFISMELQFKNKDLT